ncbi:MAG: amino acid permease, partial [Betaproteobacteria bacterium]|nr:amino acid permease [Betaproteobacteria bacterium]
MHSPRTLLSARSAISIVVGLVIGVGIFKTPAIVAGLTQDAGWFVLVWLLGGVLSLAGALCYAELCTAFPHSGGEYHFLSRAYGRSLAFLYAWAKAMVINTGAIALLAFVFGDYMTSLYPLGEHSSAI